MRVGSGAGEVVTDSDRTPWNTRRRDWGGELHIALNRSNKRKAKLNDGHII